MGGAYDLGSLSQFPYSGTGYSFIVTTEGSMVSIDPRISIEENSDFFQYYSRMEVHSGNSMEQIRDDFQSGTSGYSLLSRGSDLRYLVYEPSGMGNGWMTCYVVSTRPGAGGLPLHPSIRGDPHRLPSWWEWQFCCGICSGAAFWSGVPCSGAPRATLSPA